MRTLKITAAILSRKFNACPMEVALFRQCYPRGLTITDDQETNFPKLAAACENGLDVVWFMDRLFNMSGKFHTPFYGSLLRDDYVFEAAGYLADAVGCYLTRKRRR
jgi:hypothetical protein